eukprot:CAMPEP_0177469978 /NCGR_PEP_ID=MMETSP0369-20130122/19946_1 /TAXON_ID=447022 ORGANISM="Scrippsiella hangoei-like, Strain SHHI-4" /NCGR_SAMPLE_ID=MMETSP0369 /ASSEMBLY_ACC=CAM_ASM_000364 /LENGTH=500 /DNA_ID=CAMNT_0018944387 /DNA_START=88 /DNA_END=1590 /DNA_ORIENTATION=+
MKSLALTLSVGALGALALDKKPLRTEVVLAHFAEDLGWVSQFIGKANTDIKIYSKAAELPHIAGVQAMPLPNVGRESHTFLHHIAHNYDKLADWTVFSQAVAPSWGYLIGGSANGHLSDKVSFEDYLQPFPEGRDSKFVMSASSQFPSGAQSTRLGMVKQGLLQESGDFCPKQGADGWTDWWFTPDHPHLRSGDMLEFYHKYISLDKNEGKPMTMSFSQGARFAASRARIQARPRAYYARLLAALSKQMSPQEGYWMEASWYDVLHPESMQYKTDLCALPQVRDIMTLGPYAFDSIRQQLIKSAGADCTDCDDIDVDRRLYGAGDFKIQPTGDEVVLKFVEDANATVGVQKGISKKAGVSDNAVMVTMSVINVTSRRLLGRQLAVQKVKVDYIIEYMVSSKEGGKTESDKLLAALKAMDSSALAAEILTQIEIASGTPNKYTVTVESFTAPTAISVLNAQGKVEEVTVTDVARGTAGGSILKSDISMATFLMVFLAQFLA